MYAIRSYYAVDDGRNLVPDPLGKQSGRAAEELPRVAAIAANEQQAAVVLDKQSIAATERRRIALAHHGHEDVGEAVA